MKKTSKEALASLLQAPAIRNIRGVAAFTLIEVLVVVAIIGIILSYAVPAVNSAREDALNTRVDAAVVQIASAKTRFYLANQSANEQNAPTNTEIAPYLTTKGQTATTVEDIVPSGWNVTIGNANTAPTVTRP